MSDSDVPRPRPRWFPMLPEAFFSHARAARQESRQAFEQLLPESFRAHRRAARREALLAARSLIDAALERIDKKA